MYGYQMITLMRQSKFSRSVRCLLTLTVCCMFSATINAQHVALRNNLLYDATLTPNLGIEVRVDSLWSIGADIGYNAWDINKDKNKKWRHLLVAPHFRRYLCFGDSVRLRRARYIEGDLLYSHFNVGNTSIPFGLYSGAKDRRLQGDLVAVGAKYGFAWLLGHRWWLEAEAGLAVGVAWYKEYDCDHCGTYHGRSSRFFLLPQLGVNIVYAIP